MLDREILGHLSVREVTQPGLVALPYRVGRFLQFGAHARHDVEELERTVGRWRAGTTGDLEAEVAWVRVWPAHRWQDGVPADAIPDVEEAGRWLLVEWRRDGTVKYALSNLPLDTTIARAVGWWKERRQVERRYEQLKGELGLDHFAGRRWPGFHHHATRTFLAYGFLALERQRAQDAEDPDATPGPEAPPPGGAGRGA